MMSAEEKYPKRKLTKNNGDSYTIYEEGNRVLHYPTEKDMKDLEKETEGKESDSDYLPTGEPKPVHKDETGKDGEPGSYPTVQNFFNKTLSKYRIIKKC